MCNDNDNDDDNIDNRATGDKVDDDGDDGNNVDDNGNGAMGDGMQQQGRWRQ